MGGRTRRPHIHIVRPGTHRIPSQRSTRRHLDNRHLFNHRRREPPRCRLPTALPEQGSHRVSDPLVRRLVEPVRHLFPSSDSLTSSKYDEVGLSCHVIKSRKSCTKSPRRFRPGRPWPDPPPSEVLSRTLSMPASQAFWSPASIWTSTPRNFRHPSTWRRAWTRQLTSPTKSWSR